VDPQDEFDPCNVAIHGISSDSVVGSPTFGDIMPRLSEHLAQQVVVTHTPFDKVSIGRAILKCGATPIDCTWLDSARVARRAWPECARKGYALAKITSTLGIQYQPHVASEDARAAGQLIARAIESTGLGLTDWLTRVIQPITTSATRLSAIEPNADGALAGEVVVFTGALSMPRAEAAALAADAGCTVGEGVTKGTTILVVGEQDIRRLAGHDKSSKHRKAELLISDGVPIRILTETDFRRLIETG
jgi:DNA polymerase-3 subunit epsilon